MDKNITGKNILFLKNFERYIYLSLFFLVSTFFIFFVIRPNLRQVILANQKLNQLKVIDTQYNRLLEKIIGFQGNLENHRNYFLIIDQALTDIPLINKVITDVQQTIGKNNLFIDSISVSNVDLKQDINNKEVKYLKISLVLNGNFNDFRNFLVDISRQRKIKVIDNFLIEKEASLVQSTESAALKIQLQVNSFHL
jgi:Tfp pilus assembly protein PilO